MDKLQPRSLMVGYKEYEKAVKEDRVCEFMERRLEGPHCVELARIEELELERHKTEELIGSYSEMADRIHKVQGYSDDYFDMLYKVRDARKKHHKLFMESIKMLEIIAGR